MVNNSTGHKHTVRATLKPWESNGLGGLWEAPGRGARVRSPRGCDRQADFAYNTKKCKV